MFGVMFVPDNEIEGSIFKIYDNIYSATDSAKNAVCGLGWRAIIYDYDKEQGEFYEFYEV